MDIGVYMFPTDYAIRIDELAVEAEQRGFESLWVPEHTHIPTSRQTPFPAGGELPEEYSHTIDPFVGLAAAATRTDRIKLATGICLLSERDTIITAKEVASLDTLCGGRFVFGIGGGWNREELENHGTTFETRFKRLEEQIEALKRIWTEAEAEYHGRYIDFDPIWSWPKPVQKPHPPILMGGGTNSARQRVVDFCDGWLPIGIAHDVAAGMKDLAERARAAGKRPEDFPVSIFGAPPDPDTLKQYAELGVARVNFWVPPEPTEKVLPILDQYAQVLQKGG